MANCDTHGPHPDGACPTCTPGERVMHRLKDLWCEGPWAEAVGWPVDGDEFRAMAGVIAEALRDAAGPTAPGARSWLVWSNEHEAWWGPNNCGYYADVDGAGRYTLAEALECANLRSHPDVWKDGVNPPELVHPSPELIAALGEGERA